MWKSLSYMNKYSIILPCAVDSSSLCFSSPALPTASASGSGSSSGLDANSMFNCAVGSNSVFGSGSVCPTGSHSRPGLDSDSSSGVSPASGSVSAGFDAASGCRELASGAFISGLLLGGGSASSSVFSESVPTES